jgi:hypothetical protein
MIAGRSLRLTFYTLACFVLLFNNIFECEMLPLWISKRKGVTGMRAT